SGRDILFGPGRVDFTVSLFKDFRIREQVKLQFRTEAFNVFNTPQFGQPNGSIGNAQAPVISSIVGNPRLMQLALVLRFYTADRLLTRAALQTLERGDRIERRT